MLPNPFPKLNYFSIPKTLFQFDETAFIVSEVTKASGNRFGFRSLFWSRKPLTRESKEAFDFEKLLTNLDTLIGKAKEMDNELRKVAFFQNLKFFLRM